MKKKKDKPVELVWNGRTIMIEFKDVSWIVTAVDGKYLSQDEKLNIIKAVVNYG